MAYQKLAVLTNALYKRTLSGKIEWKETALDDVYQTSLANYSVSISLVEAQRGGDPDVRISIFNDEGELIESFSDEDLSPEWLSDLNVRIPPYRLMLGIYESARRIALGSEQAINDILEELDDDDLLF